MKRSSTLVKGRLAWMLAISFLIGSESVHALDQNLVRVRAQPNVPPIDELEILDPRVDPEGKPHAQQVIEPNGTSQVEIPPEIAIFRGRCCKEDRPYLP